MPTSRILTKKIDIKQNDISSRWGYFETIGRSVKANGFNYKLF